MQPVRIGMNATLVLVLLLLAVPVQLFFNHYLQQSYKLSSTVQSEVEERTTNGEEVDLVYQARVEAMERLSSTVLGLKDQFGATLRHYSSWKNIKELFVIPRKLQKKTSGVHISTFKTENGNTISIMSNPTSKAKSLKAKSKLKTQSPAPTSPAKEVEDYMLKEVYFSQSKEPRTTRPPNVHYGVGQVVRHKLDGYHGVIIGWDTVAKAPDWWLDRFYGPKRKHVIQTPHYHILVDSQFDASGTPYRYIPSEDLEPVDSNVQVSAPEMTKFFEGFKDGKHIPRPWLKERYPSD